MVTSSRAPKLAEVLRDALARERADMRVALPGRVESYDAATQSANVRPLVSLNYAADGGAYAVDPPVIPSVPVCFPRAGSWSITFPLAVGDHVLLVFADRSLDAYRSLGGTAPRDPVDLRSHHLADAIAIPCSLVPDTDVLAPAPPSHLRLSGPAGSIHLKADGTVALGTETPVDSAATSLKVAAQLSALAAVLTTLAADLTALGVAVGVGATSAAAITALLATPWPGDVASSVVKVSP